MSAPRVKGWCPGAYNPMMSGDGLIVRIRPRLARLAQAQLQGLTEAAQRYGNGVIDLTSRANLQIRGVNESDHAALLDNLLELDLIDADPALELRRNVLCTPFWRPRDLTCRLYAAVQDVLTGLPQLPAKMGVVIDTGAQPVLTACSGDFRFERAASGQLILRADGAAKGMPVSEAEAPRVLQALVAWFVETGGANAGRMARHLCETALPEEWRQVAPASAEERPALGPIGPGYMLGTAFGGFDAPTLAELITTTNAAAVRFTPWRSFVLEGVTNPLVNDFIRSDDDPLRRVHACPGLPACTSGQAGTRDVARRLAPHLPAGVELHVSGCSKGCAHPKPASVTLVARAGRFNLVRDGVPWDEPLRSDLTIDDILRNEL